MRRAALLFFLAALLGAAPCSFAGQSRQSVLLITIDALRPDHLSCNGYAEATSPNIDRLASEGVFFTQAIAQSSWTAPSLASLVCSAFPHECLVRNGEKEFFDVRQRTTLAEILREAGIRTALFSSNPHFGRIEGLRDGFDAFNCWYPDNDAAITDAALAWLKSRKKQRFFLWVHFVGPHAPYRPPMPFDQLFHVEDSGKRLKIGADNGDRMDGSGVIPAYAAIAGKSDPGYYISQYDGEIAYSDEQAGRLVNGLRQLGLGKDTVVIISSDHGESLGEHDYYFGHGAHVYDEALKVPLVFVPGRKEWLRRRVDAQVSLIDLAPTILDILGLPADTDARGRSLLPLLKSEADAGTVPAYSERCFSGQETVRCVRSGGWKLIHKPDSAGKKYELYDLGKDPGEEHDLFGQAQDEGLRQLLDSWESGSTPAETSQDATPVSEADRKMLESLGYAQ